MSIFDLKWSPHEKKAARAAFDKAYKNELAQIRRIVSEKINAFEEGNDIGKLDDYLTQKRIEVGEKYDYRYSQLILVFARLIREGFMSIEDLHGLSPHKIEALKGILEYKYAHPQPDIKN